MSSFPSWHRDRNRTAVRRPSQPHLVQQKLYCQVWHAQGRAGLALEC